jgi:hypothetical protein
MKTPSVLLYPKPTAHCPADKCLTFLNQKGSPSPDPPGGASVPGRAEARGSQERACGTCFLPRTSRYPLGTPVESVSYNENSARSVGAEADEHGRRTAAR